MWHTGEHAHTKELQARVASLVERWHSVPAADASRTSEEWAHQLLADMLIDEPSVQRFALLFGVEVHEYVELGGGFGLRPSDPDTLRAIILDAGLKEGDWLRLPRSSASIAIHHCATSRSFFPSFAATSSWGFSVIQVERLRYGLWLATGIFPRLGDQFSYEPCAFPVTPVDHVRGRPQDLFSGDSEEAVVDIEILRNVFGRVRYLWEDAEGQESENLRRLLQHAELIQANPDPVVVSTVAYAAIDGYLRDHGEKDKVTVTRLSSLVASDGSEARLLRRVGQAWYEVRSHLAHGVAAPAKHLALFLGRDVVDAADPRLPPLVAKRSRAILRRFILAILWVTLESQNESTNIRRTRAQVVDACRPLRRDELAFVDDVPDFVRRCPI